MCPAAARSRSAAVKSDARSSVSYIESNDLEFVVMNNAVVPWGTGPVVASIGAGHLVVIGEPTGVVVDSFPGPLGKPRFAVRHNTLRELSLGDNASVRGNVDQQPVGERGAGEIGWYFPSLLVDVIANRRNILVDHR
jgi:hypothetical protein